MKPLLVLLLLAMSAMADVITPADIRATVQHMRALAIEQQKQLDSAQTELATAQAENESAKQHADALQLAINSLRSWGEQEHARAIETQSKLDKILVAYRRLKTIFATVAGTVAAWFAFSFFSFLPFPYRIAATAGAFVFAAGAVWIIA